MSDKPPLSQGRVLLVGLVAPVVGIVVVVATSIGVAVLAGEVAGEVPGRFMHLASLFLIFGLPGSWFVEAIVGLLAYHPLRERGWLNAWTVVGIASVAGACVLLTPMVILFGGPVWEAAFLIPIGAAGGAASGAVLWWGGLRRGAS